MQQSAHIAFMNGLKPVRLEENLVELFSLCFPCCPSSFDPLSRSAIVRLAYSG